MTVRYEDGQLTRKQLLVELARRGHVVKPSALSYWEWLEHLPKGVVKYVEGSPKSLYPPEAVDNVIAYITQPAGTCPCCGNRAIKKSLHELKGKS